MLSLPVRRTLLTTLVVPLALAGASGGVGAAPPANKPEPPKRPPLPIKADRNGDKVLDDLEARLPGLGPNEGVSTIVTLTAPATDERLTGLERAIGRFAVSHRFSIIHGFAATLTKGQIQALARHPEVARVEENSQVRAFNDGAQSSFGVAKARSDAPALDGDADGSADTYSKDDLVAAVIDTGIHASHLDLDEGKVLAFKDFVNGRTAPYDDNGHGTHVAGTIAGDGDARADGAFRGVAPGGALVGVKVLDANGSGTMADVTAAIEWVVQVKDVYGIEAINLSLGASGCADGTDATSQAVNNAHAAGLVVAVAAGNDGPRTCTIGSPGAATHALTVGAMADTAAGGFKQAYFSSRGPTADGRVKPDVSAPGVGITSAQTNTTNGYVANDGTSMATPFVAGVALLMRDANAGLAPQQVKDKIRATAIDWARGGDNKTTGSTGADIDYGAGRLDAYAALAAAGAPLASPPATPRRAFREGSLPGSGAVVDYKLEVGDVSFPIAATLIIPALSAGAASTPDFDLYLYNPSGSLVAAAETVNRQEDIGYKPTAVGTYTLRVRSYSGSGGYLVDVSAGLTVDTTAPSVSSVAPADGATGVAGGTNVSVAFSEPMDTASAQQAFSLVKSADGSAVSGTFAWSGDTMIFDPSSNLASGSEYTAKVTTVANDKAGNALAAEKMWKLTTAAVTSTTVYPGSTAIVSGSLRSGDASRLAADDGAYYQVNSTTSSTYTSAWYGKLTGVSNALTSLKVTYAGMNSRSCSQTLAIFRWSDSKWVTLDSRSVGTTEVLIADKSPSGTLADYVSGSSGDGEARIRVRCTTTGGKLYASGDLMKITFTK